MREKIVHAKDFTLLKLMEQGVDIFTHLDSKLFKSLVGLLFKPGFLANECIYGRRKPYMNLSRYFYYVIFCFVLARGLYSQARCVGKLPGCNFDEVELSLLMSVRLQHD
jgi:hypothetical protein